MLSQHIKPNITHEQATELITRVFGLTVSQIRPLPSYDDQNFYVKTSQGNEYVLKILNSADSENPTLSEIQTHAMNFLNQQCLPTQSVIPTTTGQLMTFQTFDGTEGKVNLVRLLTHLPGTVVAKIPCSPQILYQIGQMAAKVDEVLHKMEHPNIEVLHRKNFIWNLSSTPLLESYISVIDRHPIQPVVKEVIQLYKCQILPKLGSFRKCLNHGDLNDHNILVEPKGPTGYKISGILDFGDMSFGYFIFELSITIMYMMVESPNPIDVGGPVLAGWESIFPLNETERDSLYLLVLCRFCQSIVLAYHTVTLHPENKEYLMITVKTGIKILSQLWEMGKEQVQNHWFEEARRQLEKMNSALP